LSYLGVYPREHILPKAYRNFLKWLNSSLTDLKVSQVEYAVDFYCSKPNAVADLFQTIIKNLYVPYSKQINFIGGQTAYGANGKRFNLVYRVGNNFKIYERGPNRMKKKPGWLFNALDRVRFEHTAKSYNLRKHGIIYLDDLISDSKFFKINFDKWQFKFFLSKKLPAPYDFYSSEVENGKNGTFLSELIGARHEIKNIAQYVFNLSEFMDLDCKLKYAMAEFDDFWQARNGQF
jgi:hypothetical protein